MPMFDKVGEEVYNESIINKKGVGNLAGFCHPKIQQPNCIVSEFDVYEKDIDNRG